jgi:signal transduction histidine kinase
MNDYAEMGMPRESVKRFHLGIQRSRAVAYLISFVAFFVPKALGVFTTPAWHAVVLLIAVLITIEMFYLAYLREVDTRLGIRLEPFWIASDVFFGTLGVHITGGAASPWFVWYIGPAGVAAFALGTRAAYITHLANYFAYLVLLRMRGELTTATDFYLATTKMFFLLASTYFIIEGIATLKERRIQIAKLKLRESEKVRELTALNEQLELLATQLEEQSRELAEANARLSEANRRIQEHDQRKSAFLASMSHELRTPLTAILGFADILEAKLKGEIAPRFTGFLSSIVVSGRHLLDLINDVLDLSKVESGRMEFHPESIDVATVIDDVQNVLRGTAGKYGILITTEAPSNLPLLKTDAGKLKQILYNLIANAVKFSPPEGLVTVRAFVDDSTLAISVTDRGIGIDQDELELIFEEFRQSRSAAHTTFGGTGLGLALVKRFIELQGGSIEVESAPGRGSTFTCRFPLEVREEHEARVSGDVA